MLVYLHIMYYCIGHGVSIFLTTWCHLNKDGPVLKLLHKKWLTQKCRESMETVDIMKCNEIGYSLQVSFTDLENVMHLNDLFVISSQDLGNTRQAEHDHFWVI